MGGARQGTDASFQYQSSKAYSVAAKDSLGVFCMPQHISSQPRGQRFAFCFKRKLRFCVPSNTFCSRCFWSPGHRGNYIFLHLNFLLGPCFSACCLSRLSLPTLLQPSCPSVFFPRPTSLFPSLLPANNIAIWLPLYFSNTSCFIARILCLAPFLLAVWMFVSIP